VLIEDGQGDHLVINASDFDASKHTLFVAPTAATFAPTLEQFVAAGYKPQHYPPQGFPAVDTAGLRAYRASVAAVAAPEPTAGAIDSYTEAPATVADEAAVAPLDAPETVHDRQAIAAAMEDTVEPAAVPAVSAIDEALARRKGRR